MQRIMSQTYLGGDISYLPSYEENGTVYRDSAGNAVDFLGFVRQQGWNAARVRLFVDPDKAPQEHRNEGVCQNLNYITPLCQQIKAVGMRLMIDFHYSDTWADPGKQFIPARWKGHEQDLADSIYAYTKATLEHLKAAGAEPDLIQVGNEITFGMDWPTGKVDPQKDANWYRLSKLLQAGVRACREVTPRARVIIHTEHAQDWNATRGFYERLERYGVDYDVIGLSYYPMWHGSISHLGTVLDSLDTEFHKPVMIVETAAYYSRQNDKWAKANEEIGPYEASVEGQRDFTHDLVTELLKHRNVKGLFWWFAEENESGKGQIASWLNRGLFSNKNGRALPALYELKSFASESVPTLFRRPIRRRNPILANGQEFSPSTLIVLCDGERGKKQVLKAAKKYGCEVIYDYKIINGYAFRIPKDKSLEETEQYLKGVKGVTGVNRDQIMHLDGAGSSLQ